MVLLSKTKAGFGGVRAFPPSLLVEKPDVEVACGIGILEMCSESSKLVCLALLSFRWRGGIVFSGC